MKLPIAPNRELGQHFLVDENILGVAGRLADLQREDVVLEVGAGLGVLTAYLAERVRLEGDPVQGLRDLTERIKGLID